MVIGTDCIGSCKSNYDAITAMMVCSSFNEKLLFLCTGDLFGCVSLLRQPVIPTAYYSDDPLFRRPIFPTMQNRTQSTNPWFNEVYPTGWSVGQANLDGPWPRQNVLERKRSFYPRLYIPAQGNYDRPTWYGES